MLKPLGENLVTKELRVLPWLEIKNIGDHFSLAILRYNLQKSRQKTHPESRNFVTDNISSVHLEQKARFNFQLRANLHLTSIGSSHTLNPVHKRLMFSAPSSVQRRKVSPTTWVGIVKECKR